MKKEDFIVGKWYVSSKWTTIIAAKFSNFRKNDNFAYSEYLTIISNHRIYESYTTSDYKQWNTFREVPVSEIQHLLPKDHPDLNPEYVKCVKTININNISGNTINKIYKVKDWNYTHTECMLENELGSCSKSRFVPSTKEEYDKQEYSTLGLNFFNDFPKEGCYFDDDDILVNYLIKNNYTQNIHASKKYKTSQYLKWDNFKYWYLPFESKEVKNYTTEQIHQLINYNTNQNEKNTLQSIETENSRPNQLGTIAIRRGRQQITVGNRPDGNQTSAKIGRTEINSIKICKNIVKSANY